MDMRSTTGSKPTSATSEDTAIKVANMPWQGSSQSGKYQYHPDGNPANAPKDAPSALHSVIVPNVSLPKVCGFDCKPWGEGGLSGAVANRLR